MSYRKRPEKINNELGLRGNGVDQRVDISLDQRYNFKNNEWSFIIFFSAFNISTVSRLFQLFENPGVLSMGVDSGTDFFTAVISNENTAANPGSAKLSEGFGEKRLSSGIITRKGNEVISYFNGHEIAKTIFPNTDTFNFANLTLRLFSRYDLNGQFHEGFINNVITLNNGLSQNEVRIITRNGGGYIQPSLHKNILNHWTFNQNSYYADKDAFLPIYSKGSSASTGLLVGESLSNQYTIGTWIYTNENFNTSPDTYFSSIYNLNDGSSNAVATIYKTDSSGIIRFRAGSGIGNTGLSFGNKELHFIAYSCDGINDEVNLYIDGEFITTEPAEGFVIQDEIGLTMSNFPNGSFGSGDVLTSDVFIYDGLKTSNEISNLYNYGSWKRANLIDTNNLINYIKLSSSTRLLQENIEESAGLSLKDPLDPILSRLPTKQLLEFPDATIQAWDSVEQYQYSRPGVLIDSEDDISAGGSSIGSWTDPSSSTLRFEGTYDSINKYTVIELVNAAGTGANWSGTYTNILPAGYEDGYKRVRFKYNSNGKLLKFRNIIAIPEFIELPVTTEFTEFEYIFDGGNSGDDIKLIFSIQYVDDSYEVGDQFFVKDLTLDLSYKPIHAKLINFTEDEVGANNNQSSLIYNTKSKKRVNPIGINYRGSGGNRVTGMTTTHGWTTTSNFTFLGTFKVISNSNKQGDVNTIIGFGRNVGGFKFSLSVTSNIENTISSFRLATAGGVIIQLTSGEDYEGFEFKKDDILKYSITFDSVAPLLKATIFNTRTLKAYEFNTNTYTSINYSNNNSFFVGGQISGSGAREINNIEAALYKDEALTTTQINDYFDTNEFPITANIFGAWYLSDENYMNSIKDISGVGVDLGSIDTTGGNTLISDYVQLNVDTNLPIIKKSLKLNTGPQKITVPLLGNQIGTGGLSMILAIKIPNTINVFRVFTEFEGSGSRFYTQGNLKTFKSFPVTDSYSNELKVIALNLDNTGENNKIQILGDEQVLNVSNSSTYTPQDLTNLDFIIGTDSIGRIDILGCYIYDRTLTQKELLSISNTGNLHNKVKNSILALSFNNSDFYEDGTNVYVKDYSGNNNDGIISGFSGATTVEQLENIKLNLVDIDKYVRNDTSYYLTQFGTIEADQVIFTNEPINTLS